MFLKSRIRRLESKVGPSGCPTCNLPPNGPGRIVLSDERAEHPLDHAERCASCGRCLWFVIEVCPVGPDTKDFIEVVGEGAAADA